MLSARSLQHTNAIQNNSELLPVRTISLGSCCGLIPSAGEKVSVRCLGTNHTRTQMCDILKRGGWQYLQGARVLLSHFSMMSASIYSLRAACGPTIITNTNTNTHTDTNHGWEWASHHGNNVTAIAVGLTLTSSTKSK